jgi:hypothetical protein
MSPLVPIALLWLLQKGDGKAATPVWPSPPPKPKAPATPATPATPGTTPATPTPTPVGTVRPLPDATWKPHPSPIPMHVIEVAQSLLRTLPYGQWEQRGAVIYRKETHAPGRTGITAYVQR